MNKIHILARQIEENITQDDFAEYTATEFNLDILIQIVNELKVSLGEEPLSNNKRRIRELKVLIKYTK